MLLVIFIKVSHNQCMNMANGTLIAVHPNAFVTATVATIRKRPFCKNRLPATPEGVSTGSQPAIVRQELLSEPNAAVCIQQRSRAPQIVCQVIISPRKVIFSATPATKRCSLPQCPSAIHFLAENGQLARPTLATWRLDHEGKAVYTHAQE